VEFLRVSFRVCKAVYRFVDHNVFDPIRFNRNGLVRGCKEQWRSLTFRS